MYQNSLILLSEVITKDGGISAEYLLVTVVSILGLLIVAFTGFAFNSLNNNVKNLGKMFEGFQSDFHKFVESQSGLNAKFEERTKEKN